MIFWAHPDCEAALPPAAEAAYDLLARLPAADALVEKQGRSTARCRLETAAGSVSFYLKRYPRLPWWQRRLAPLNTLPGPREWENLRRVAALGVRGPEALAVGADRRHPCASFFATRDLAEHQPLHELIPRRFGAGSKDAALKRSLIRALAQTARRLHAADLYHRDFYLCHFFLRETPGADPPFDLVLIDFTRLKRSRHPRWRVKDLAQLLFSSDLPGITRTDRLRFFLAYLGVDRLDPSARSLLRQVERKAERYHRHNDRQNDRLNQRKA